MSISYRELIALRRAHLQKQKNASHENAKELSPDKGPDPSGAAYGNDKDLPEWLQSESPISSASSPRTLSYSKGETSSATHTRPAAKYNRTEGSAALPVEVQPKVMAPDVPIRGELPKSKIQDRKRARQETRDSLEVLLQAQGIPVDNTIREGDIGSYHTLLPLEAFDDELYEELQPSDWIKKLEMGGGNSKGLPCRAYRTSHGKGGWTDGYVKEWLCDGVKNLLRVSFPADSDFLYEKETGKVNVPSNNKGATMEWLPRIYVCLDAEDRITFSRRYISAYLRRKLAESIMRSDLYVEAIPPDEYQVLDPSVLERIRQICLSTPMLIEGESNLDIQNLLEEIRVDYSRTMNASLFQAMTKNGGMRNLFGGAQLPPVATPEAPPFFGIDPEKCKQFPAIVRCFRSSSLIAGNAISHLLLRFVWERNDTLIYRNVFKICRELDALRPMTTGDFDDIQNNALRENNQYLRDAWISMVTAKIKDTLGMASEKDELHLLFVDEDGYLGSKTSRFLTRVNTEMQDALQDYLITSLETFTRFIEDAANFNIFVEGINNITTTVGSFDPPSTPYGRDPRVSAEKLRKAPHMLAPLFKVSLQLVAAPTNKTVTIKEGEHTEEATNHDDFDEMNLDDIPWLRYTYTAHDILSQLNNLITRCLSGHSEIRSVERRIFDFLYDPAMAFLPSLRLDNPIVLSCLARIKSVFDRLAVAMDAYLETYSEYKDIARLNVKDYTERFNENFPKTKGIENEIQRFLKRKDEILSVVPQSVNLGIVSVDGVELRRQLSNKCAMVANDILTIMAERALSKEVEIEERFTDLHETLMKQADTPEDVVATKDFIKTIPEQVFDLQLMIQETKEIHDILDFFHCPLSEEEFSRKWRAIGWPAKLDEEINQRLQELEDTTRSIVACMNRSQDVFEKEVEQMQRLVEEYHRHCSMAKLNDIVSDVNSMLERIQRLREQANTFNRHEGLFNLEKTDYSAVHQLSSDFEPYASLWLTIDDWARAMNEWYTLPFEKIDAEEMERRVMEDYKSIGKSSRETKLTRELIQIAESTKEKIEGFKPLVPIVKSLRTDGIRDRHWEQISKELGREVKPGSTLNNLSDVEDMNLKENIDVLTRLSEVASREYQIEVSLSKMKAEWESIRLSVKPYKETSCFIVAKDVVDDTQEKLDDQMLITQSLSFSPFKKLFEAEIVSWEANLKLVQDVLDQWLAHQKSWLYLEPIFQSEDISRQLPMEYKRFQGVNKIWKMLTTKAHEVDLTMPFCTTTENCLSLLKESNSVLELVERGLNQYLENKRASFARFYFLSDDELLTILSEAKNPQKIQPQFRKLFENIARIEMREPDNEMFGMYSHMKEYIPFVQTVFPRKYVENWLTEIEFMMKNSIRAQLEKGMKDFVSMERKDFILNSPGQVVIAVNQIMWTHECEESLRIHGSLKPYVPQAQKSLMLLVESVRQQLSNLQRMNLGGLITIEVHARDIVDSLARENIDSVLAFEWVSQLRSYWENNDCYLRQVEAQFRYGGEYLGNTTRLVITPLTDRIYLTLTGAMHMFLGGAPAGPAGTGKTETVKDLAKAVAKQCVVFNCQEGMTYASMGKFFKGLAQAGAWACFDEFNRIDVEVLSVVAQQVSSLQEAARSKQYRIPFEGTEIVVDPSYSVFITMNPGYAGRTELPDNLKVLFRPVACMVPDYAMIAEIRLFSFGYAESRKLAQKMVATFRLSSEQLSSQDHYDFGMRAVNTVISAAGLMKRENPDEQEDVLLLRALRDSNAPKFLEEDLMLFNGIISDLFPGTEIPKSDYGAFLVTLTEKAVEMHLQPTEMFLKKCIQLYEMSVLRHGQMSVGPTMGGKTSATRVLQAAMTKLRKEMKLERFAEVKTYCLNPKSITMSQLYGGFDEATGEWKDGLVGELFRIAARDTTDARQWIIFDGPVDALWIESMNTVLDDNKKLCLISGEIITMTPYMNCWFEVEDLAVASPATVSRAGMIYMEPGICIGVGSFIKSWKMHRLPVTMDPYKDYLEDLCQQAFPALISFVQTQVTEYSASVWPNLIVSCFNIFSAFLKPFTPTRTYEVPQEKLDLLREVHVHFLVFAIVWSFGATGDSTSRQRFDKFFRDELRLRNVNIELPVIGCLQDYEFIPEERRWVSWTERLPPFTTQVTQNNMSDIIVPTADVSRFKYINRLLLENSYHTLCCGPTGTGKTVLLQQLLMNEMPKEFTPIFFTFSARTSANQTQDLIFSKFEVRRRASPQIWGAPVNKKFVVFIDDMNMPMKEQYGAQPPIEILRQYMDYSGWYDRRTREFFNIVDVLYVGAMGPPGGGRNKISNRFLRHFNQIAFPEIDDDNMRRIFVTILESYFQPFPEDIQSKIRSVVGASIEIFNIACKELRPTPSRPHYLFNLRDLSKVVGGLLNATPKTVTTPTELARLWIHEERRTFQDRLTNLEDRSWFDKQLEKQLQRQLKVPVEDVLPRQDDSEHGLLYVDFLNTKVDIRVYEEVKSFGNLVQVLEKNMEEYNQQSLGHKLNLVMFSDAVQHVCRIARVIRKPNGHVLLLGVGGSGRQSLSRLAAYLNEYEVSQVEISKGYTTNIWREDIKSILRLAAFKKKQVLFLFTDTQIVHESMLEDVNNLLNSGEVPNLFLGQEFDDLLNVMKPICIAEGISLDKVSVYSRFVKFCRFNLHISVCMSPLGETFRSRLRMFPALVSCCTIDWFSSWPRQALQSVAKNFFSSFQLISNDPIMVESCTEMCVQIHQTVEAMSKRFLEETKRHNYITPTSFLELLNTFKMLLTKETQTNLSTRNQLINGLEKLRETEGAVAGLQQTLEDSQPVLLQKQESIKKLVEEMEVQTASAEVTKKEAQSEREMVAEKQKECASIEEEAQGQLAEALPELDRALESLKNLKSSQITEVAGYKAPTPGVVMTVQGICILFQIKPIMRAANAMEEKKPDYWQTSKEQLLNNPNLLMQRLVNYDKEHIPEKLIQAVMPLVTSEDFTPKKIAGASQACAAMCQWTHAMVRFHAVNKKVEPLRQKLAIAQEANRSAQEKLRQAEERLEEVARKLAALQETKENAEKEMRTLEETVEITELKLKRAAMLIDGLAGEKKNWRKKIEELNENSKYLIGDMLAAAGQISYLGPFTFVYRSQLLAQWRQELKRQDILHNSSSISVYHTLQDPVVTREWGINGLPMDTVSVENAIFLSHARRWPLMIDPQTQANKWIRKTYREGLEILKPSQKDLIKRIEYSIRAGHPVLLENVGEDIDASLNPLLNRQTFKQGGQEMIRISENPIPWNPEFKFFMTTKHPNPHYIPEVMVRVTLLNFFITPQGLEDQLLGVVVGQERKELELRRSDLIQKNAAMKADLVLIQKTILKKMEEVQGDILNDEVLIQYLNESKEKTSEIVSKVAEAEEAEKEINISREGYRPIAKHSSCLYFCCATLSNVDPMYQYSLQWFVQLFLAGIEGADRAEELETRLKNLKDYFTYSFYQNISRSLFEKHKLMFSFFLCIRILEQDDLVDEAEFRFLLQGPSITVAAQGNPDPSWMTTTTWNDINYLDRTFAPFKGIAQHIKDNVGHYKEIFMSAAAHRQPLAGRFESSLTPMQRIMFIRCLRADKLMEAVQDFVTEKLGERFIRPPPFDLLTSFKDSSAITPLIFVLSQGADPYDDWKKFAETQRMSKKLYDISLGQGQGPRAERMLQEGMENGYWVLLQNCHLATSWMPTLERIVESMTGEIHPSFRLWLTSMPSPHFPVLVLQNGLKMTNEPPKGMQANVSRSILSYSNDYLDTCQKPREYKKLFFSMCFFHALIQERRKFGPLGWNIAYEYTSGDLNCCVAQIKMFLDKYDQVPYRVISELSGNIHYGGRVTDDWDRRTLMTILETFVNESVMEDGYQFSPLKDYCSVSVTDQKGYLECVASWPLNTNPEAFGLHENADITCARSETFDTLAALVLLHGESSASTSSAGHSADDAVTEVASRIRQRVVSMFEIEKYQKKFPTKYEDSMNTVVVQEAIRFNRLIQVLIQTLDTLPLAIKGEVVMSKELEDVFRSIYNNQVPAQWAEKAYPSLKPLASWVDDFVQRLEMIQQWYDKGHPKAYWISGFFFPQAFLTGMLQNYARKMQISIDTISYDFEWKNMDPESVDHAPPSGCYVYGMFMEGARFDVKTGQMEESMPKVLFESVPMLWLKPTVNREKPISGVYNCPLYKTVRRAGTLSTTGHSTNYVLTAEIPTSLDPKHWVKRGVALVCALST